MLLLFEARRRPNKQASAEKAARRKSAPPNSLAIKPAQEDTPPVIKPREAPARVSPTKNPTPSQESALSVPAAANRQSVVHAAGSASNRESGAATQRERYQERRSRRPLDGGTLMREGKIFKAPARDKKNMPLKQAQVKSLIHS